MKRIVIVLVLSLCLGGVLLADVTTTATITDTTTVVASSSTVQNTLSGPLGFLLSLAAAIPLIGQIMAGLVALSLALSALITALDAAWHAVIKVVEVMAMLPGCSGLGNIAKSLRVKDALIDIGESKVLAFLAQLSLLPLPKK